MATLAIRRRERQPWHKSDSRFEGIRSYRWKSRCRQLPSRLHDHPPVSRRTTPHPLLGRSPNPRAMGIRDRPTAPRSPWQNGHSERLIGSIRRECLDYVVVFGECHLRHVLASYAAYYNQARTHLSLNKDAPLSRPIQTIGRIFPRPILGGLHHHYVRI